MAALGLWGETLPQVKPSDILKSGASAPVAGIGKVPALLVGGAAGLIGGALLLGGGQEQKQQAEQTTSARARLETQQEQQQRMLNRLWASIKSAQEQRQIQTVGPVQPSTTTTTTITGGAGDITYTPTNITETVTITGASAEQFSGVINALAQLASQQATPTQTVTVTPSQNLSQEQTKQDSSIWLFAIAGLVAAFMFWRKK